MSLAEELYDIFYVTQLTRGTALERLVAVDRVRVEPYRCSQIHRHMNAETVLYIESGFGIISVNDVSYEGEKGSRICIPAGAWHGVTTYESDLVFTSVQFRPIYDAATGRLDLEPLKK